MKKLCFFALAVFLALFVSCNNNDSEDENLLVLSLGEIKIPDGIKNNTTEILIASEEVHWHSTNKSVVTVDSEYGKSTNVLVQGNGSAYIIATTKNQKQNAVCKITVELKKVSCHPLKSIEIDEYEIKADSVLFYWNAPDDATEVKIEVYKESEPKKLLKTEYFPNSNEKWSGTIEDLDQGTNYIFKAYACTNGGIKDYEYVDSTEHFCLATTLESIEAPENINSLTSVVTDHSVTFKWKDPDDKKYSYVVVSTDGKDVFDNSIEERQVLKGYKKVEFAGLKSNAEYNFTFKTADKFGNIQGDANNLSNAGITLSITTQADESIPKNLSSPIVLVENTSGIITWDETNAASSSDFVKVELHCGNKLLGSSPRGQKSMEFNLESGDAEYTLYAVDYDNKKSEGVSFNLNASAVSDTANNVAVSASIPNGFNLSGELYVTWTSSSKMDFIICAVNNNNSTEILYSDCFKASSENGYISGLTVGKTYTVSVYPAVKNDLYSVVYKTSATGKSAKVKSSIYSFIQPWGQQSIVPFVGLGSSFINVILANDEWFNEKLLYYKYWIVHPALDGDRNGFSLEACTETGQASDLYLFFGTASGTTNYDSHENGWGYSSVDHTHLSRTVSRAAAKNEASYASFTLPNTKYTGDSTKPEGYSDYQAMKLNADSTYIYSNNYNISCDKNYSDSSMDFQIAYKEIKIAE